MATMLGEGDGNRMRRIYTDGRPHPSDPDLTIHGHSIGRWDGDAGGYFLEATLADGKVMTYSVELPE